MIKGVDYTNDSPEWITNDEKRYILFVGILKNFIALSLNHIPIGESYWFFIESFLLGSVMGGVLGNGYGCDGPNAPSEP